MQNNQMKNKGSMLLIIITLLCVVPTFQQDIWFIDSVSLFWIDFFYCLGHSQLVGFSLNVNDFSHGIHPY